MADDESPSLIDAEGNEWRVVAGSAHGWSIGRDGTVTHFEESETGEREEWTEPLSSSPVRNVFAPWLWNLLDEELDPRREGGGTR